MINLDEKPPVLLWSVSQLWQRKRKESLKAAGLTLAQYITLATLHWLTEKDEKVTQVMLAERAKLDVMHTSRIVRTLEKRGLLTREQSSADSRSNYLRITARGIQLAQQCSEVLDTTTNRFFQPIKSQEQEFVALMKALMDGNDISTKKKFSIKIKRIVHMPIETVWRAWTQENLMGQWLSPEGWTTSELTLDLTVGGEIRANMAGNPIQHIGPSAEVQFRGVFRVIEAPSNLVFTWNWADQIDTQVTIKLKEVDKARQTEVVLVHEGFTDKQAAKQDRYAWTSTLNNLEHFLAK